MKNKYTVMAMCRWKSKDKPSLSELTITAECSEQAEEKAMSCNFVVSVNQVAELAS